MNDIIVNKWAMGLAIFSFGFLSVGSFLFGATATTSVLRGLGGGVLFGSSLWLVGLLISKEEDPANDDIEEEGDTDQKSTEESVSVDTEGVRQKFLKKSAELEEKAKAEKDKEEKDKEEKFNKEATPF
jgi:hypothetical protein